ncbi:hypothetical protein A3Q40_00886 [Rhodococcus sp. PBTS 1]|nr:hypothetical protein A3Q40_00886 [Rhodococcus sp. PBTS 1]
MRSTIGSDRCIIHTTPAPASIAPRVERGPVCRRVPQLEVDEHTCHTAVGQAVVWEGERLELDGHLVHLGQRLGTTDFTPPPTLDRIQADLHGLQRRHTTAHRDRAAGIVTQSRHEVPLDRHPTGTRRIRPPPGAPPLAVEQMPPMSPAVTALAWRHPVGRNCERGQRMVQSRRRPGDQLGEHLDVVTDGRPRKRPVPDHPPRHENTERWENYRKWCSRIRFGRYGLVHVEAPSSRRNAARRRRTRGHLR